MIFALLYVLGTIDGGLAGYRAYAGRSALLDKRVYHRRAVIRGLVAAQVSLAFIGLTAGALILAARDRAALLDHFAAAGVTMVWVFAPYTLAFVGAFALFVIPWADIRVLTSVIVFGPFTLLRPWVILAGLAAAAARSLRPETAAVCAVALVAMLAMEPLLSRMRPPDGAE